MFLTVCVKIEFSLPRAAHEAPGDAQEAPRAARTGPRSGQEPPKSRHPLFGVNLLEIFFVVMFSLLVLLKGVVLKYALIFHRFLGRHERCTGWAHMQSVHACAGQAHFSVFARFVKEGSLKSPNWVNLGVIVD